MLYLEKQLKDENLWTEEDDDVLRKGDSSRYYSVLVKQKGLQEVELRKQFLGI